MIRTLSEKRLQVGREATDRGAVSLPGRTINGSRYRKLAIHGMSSTVLRDGWWRAYFTSHLRRNRHASSLRPMGEGTTYVHKFSAALVALERIAAYGRVLHTIGSELHCARCKRCVPSFSRQSGSDRGKRWRNHYLRWAGSFIL